MTPAQTSEMLGEAVVHLRAINTHLERLLTVQSGPFKGKPQQWFTRKEVIALLTGTRGAKEDQRG
jgi:hypothetical protein